MVEGALGMILFIVVTAIVANKFHQKSNREYKKYRDSLPSPQLAPIRKCFSFKKNDNRVWLDI